MELKEYLNKGKHIPDFMKDFHDQKYLFKAIYQQWIKENEILERVNWVDAHVFTIDIFLWWMGLHGYKLQKSRKKGIDFYDTDATISHFTEARKDMFSSILKERSKTKDNE